MAKHLPATGRTWNDLEREMDELRRDDLDWRRGRHAAFIWYATEEIEQVARDAYAKFMTENGLGARVFPSLRRMEEDVVAIVAGLVDGDDTVAGNMTSGGTESIFLAAKAARDWARANRPSVSRPAIVAPFSAHPGINKAAHYLGMDVARVPVAEDFRADPAAMSAAITPDTVMLYASAPAYSLGVIDPIAALGRLAQERGLWLHVDACVGGVLAPFVRRLEYPVPEFGFRLTGISSISADLHKSGYAAKGASVILFGDDERRKFAGYEFEDWPSGLYSTPTFPGTRPGGAIAAAWAVLHYLGEEGYLRIAETVMRARDRFIEGLTRIDGLHVWGEPDLWAVAFGADGYDILAVADAMNARGWYVGRVREPRGIHLMITPVHAPVIDEYLDDLAACAAEVRRSAATSTERVRY
jgi:glutamate/tyrosine decarboxylase-like PLP-dependent enzyme